MKVVDPKKLWNYVADNFFIWNNLPKETYIWISKNLKFEFFKQPRMDKQEKQNL